jgi:hypothetical protein
MSVSIYLIVLLGAGFLVLWYTTYRVMQRDGDAERPADAFSSLRKLTLALLLLFAFIAMQLLVGAAVWFATGFFFTGVSDEWRRQIAVAAAMMVWVLVFTAPWRALSK